MSEPLPQIPLKEDTTSLTFIAFTMNNLMKQQEKTADAVQNVLQSVAVIGNKVENLEESYKNANTSLTDMRKSIEKSTSNNKAFVKIGGLLVSTLGLIAGIIGYSTGFIDIKDLPKIKAALDIYRELQEDEKQDQSIDGG